MECILLTGGTKMAALDIGMAITNQVLFLLKNILLMGENKYLCKDILL